MSRGPAGLEELLGWPVGRVADWVAGNPEPLVVGWPFNGTRRWFVGYRRGHAGTADYLSTLVRRQAEFHGMLLDHGVSVVLAPSFGELNLDRGEEYARHALGGIVGMATDEAYADLFRRGVRVRFYGDYRRTLARPGYRKVLEACDEIEASTAQGGGPLILVGLFADKAHGAVARLAVELFEQTGEPPDRATLIEAYYGVPVGDLGFFVGFEQPQLFDVPLLTTGLEDLYYTLNPTPEVDEAQLRAILYDHLVVRRRPEIEYEKLPEKAQRRLVEANRSHGVVGLGRVDPLTGAWRPVLPEGDDPR